MFSKIMKMVVGSRNDRYLKSLAPVVAAINALEPKMQALDDAAFPARIVEMKQEVANGRPLDEFLPEVFAMVREVGKRTMDMRHFDVQLIGGMVLHQGRIAEMKTGEGKTLVATLPAVLNALSGKGVHLITVNDYLARRDAAWMGTIYAALGLTVGTILHGLTDEERQAGYASDITYGTNNEFGFDYLRDNMKFYKEHLVQRDLNFAIVDEVDSILVDEARTPLIISGPAEESTALYSTVDALIPLLKNEAHFTIDEKAKSIVLTDDGVGRCEELLRVENLYDPANINLQHHVLQGLRAHHLYGRDVDYIVKEGQVVIVDEFTGRLMPGRRYSDGLHQALEAKEGVKVESENQTLASITFQNYFRMYKKLSGMTGTADTEAVEFKEIYNLEVAVIPTHRNMVRIDHPDSIYKTEREKFAAIVQDVKRLYEKGQPVLVGTISIEKSELLSSQLKKAGVPHEVLNAKQHEREAQIVADAGQQGKVTIATNMAGRGTDIKLGEGVIERGGLFILGTERHESRRIDNQLRGRSGRQGDPGESRFYLALDDELMRLFGSDRLKGIMERLGMEEGEAIENRMVSKAIENAQKRVEGHNFEIRKQLLEFDNVMNQQREVIYSNRRHYMAAENPEEIALGYIDEILDEIYEPLTLSKQGPDQESLEITAARMEETFNLRVDFSQSVPAKEDLRENLVERLRTLKEASPDHYPEILRYFLLESLDKHWKEHLLNMDHLRDGIGLRGYGQKDPKQEYKREGFEMFQSLLDMIADSTVRALTHIRIKAEVREEEFQHKETAAELKYSGPTEDGEEKKQIPKRRAAPKVGRNDPCSCGSGKKYKKCCGAKG